MLVLFPDCWDVTDARFVGVMVHESMLPGVRNILRVNSLLPVVDYCSFVKWDRGSLMKSNSPSSTLDYVGCRSRVISKAIVHITKWPSDEEQKLF